MLSQYSDIIVMAHPECPPEVIAASDYSGSTAQMDKFIKEKQPKHAMLITECSMSHNLMSANPGVELLGSCQMCPHMKRITLPKILSCLQTETPEVIIPADIIPRARRAVERMMELS
jgi:quinolinate synthase